MPSRSSVVVETLGGIEADRIDRYRWEVCAYREEVSGRMHEEWVV